MNTYLTIMVTILVMTQVIRITQNTIQLLISEKKIKDAVGWIKDNNVSEHDFDVQRDVFYMLNAYLVDHGYGQNRPFKP